MLPEPGRETNMRTCSGIVRTPMAAEAKHETNKQKNKMALRKEVEKNEEKKSKKKKHEPLLACSSSPAQLLLLLRGKAPALQISATSNVRYRLLTLAHTGTAPACWWRRSDVDTVLLLSGRPGTQYPVRYDQFGKQKHRDGPQRDTPAPCRPFHTLPTGCISAFTQHPV